MIFPEDEFGSSASTRRELRTVLIGVSSAIVVLLLFGTVLAVRLRSTGDITGLESSDAAVVVSTDTEAGDASPSPTGPEADPTLARADQAPSAAAALDDEKEAVDSAGGTRASRPATDASTSLRFGVRVGIFEVPSNADRIMLTLQAAGYEPFVVFDRSPEGTFRYVYAASAPSAGDAIVMARELEDALGLETHIEPVEPIR